MSQTSRTYAVLTPISTTGADQKTPCVREVVALGLTLGRKTSTVVMSYTKSFKEQLVRRMIGPPVVPVRRLVAETGVSIEDTAVRVEVSFRWACAGDRRPASVQRSPGFDASGLRRSVAS